MVKLVLRHALLVVEVAIPPALSHGVHVIEEASQVLEVRVAELLNKALTTLLWVASAVPDERDAKRLR